MTPIRADHGRPPKVKREQRPENLDSVGSASWDAYDAMWDQYEKIAGVLLPPPGYAIDAQQWRDDLIDSLFSFGCDWLDHFMQRQAGNTVAMAVELLALSVSSSSQPKSGGGA